MTDNLSGKNINLPNNIWIGFDFEHILPRKTLFQRVLDRLKDVHEYPVDFDFEIIVLCIDKNGSILNKTCFLSYDSMLSFGVELQLSAHSLPPIAPDYYEIVAIDFSKIDKEVQSMKFILNNHNSNVFYNCKIEYCICSESIYRGATDKKILDFQVNPTIKFNLIELFEINCLENRQGWKFEIKENIIPSSADFNIENYIEKHIKS